ncbi:MAG: hypothetical protein HYZ10_15390 [Ignavibacteriales bacterium]|nr:hypothetical protein [Ignavibacteriales bacterium]
MESNNCKIKIKFGLIEIDYEGTEGFVKSELLGIIEKISNLTSTIPIQTPALIASPNNPNANKNLSTSIIASKTGVKNGPDLVMAAVGFIAIGLGKESFSRGEILDNMKSATTYYQKNFASNLTQSLNSLVKDKKLLHISGDNYSISEESLNSIRSILG